MSASNIRATAYVGLGSNLDNPLARVKRAFEDLAAQEHLTLVSTSSIYRSAPMGPQDQPDYINAVACVETDLSPLALLHVLQAIERAHDRVRLERWGPRTLDLDLLLYENITMTSDELTLPHPGLGVRNFVLVPLYEIAPQLCLPDNRTLDELLKACPDGGLEKIVE